MLNVRYIVIEGNIGSGKTSLAKMLSTKYEGELVLEEFAENSFLPKFYENPERWAFPLELSFLADRYRQMKLVFENAKSHQRPIISDYLFDKSNLFAGNTLAFNEFDLYSKFFSIVSESLPAPDLIVYLDTSIERLQSNIQKRGRGFEKNITAEYLKKIDKSYKNFIRTNPQLNILNLDISKLDFVNKINHFNLITQEMTNALSNNSKTLFKAL